jgi:hypothetical protein
MIVQASSSNGRAPDSKSGCWGFESLLACQKDFIQFNKIRVKWPKTVSIIAFTSSLIFYF